MKTGEAEENNMNKLDYSRVFETMVTETQNYVVGNNLKAMILGISGGIDSTVVAAICHKVSKNTGIPLIGRSLPIKNKDDEFSVSKLVGEAFCDDFKVCNLYTPYSEFINRMMTWECFNGEEGHELDTITTNAGKVFGAEAFSLEKGGQTPIANGNIQARLRMMYLYNLASIHKGLVMSTDNQTEYQLGFWTIHGDVGDFGPIQDLWKTEVYELAKWIEVMYGTIAEEAEDGEVMEDYLYKELAIHKSIALTPTDGLGISNSDLDQIGAKSYDEVDKILRCLIFYGEKVPQPVLLNFFKLSLQDKYGKEVVDKVWNRHLASEFKRKKAPIYILREKYG